MLPLPPVGEIFDPDPVLNCRLADLDDEAGRALPEVFTPGIFAENTQGLGDRFVKSLGTDLNGMLDAARVGAGDSASPDGHIRKVSSSSFVRHEVEDADRV
jgi:hypothetical protein